MVAENKIKQTMVLNYNIEDYFDKSRYSYCYLQWLVIYNFC